MGIWSDSELGSAVLDEKILVFGYNIISIRRGSTSGDCYPLQGNESWRPIQATLSYMKQFSEAITSYAR
jgi:hypothetical protein